ncbi:PREDICTED: LOC18782097 isoform [Prunus dulcis]|uniref:PREDICTED: LOC18782097 isoform n=1 Tax=Prunus dulcis TaxID=3755 RepID=A0A5E4EZM6_PRUDU|nr:PREDICTED: LOC18782097 isoform [Prunus dulcis]
MLQLTSFILGLLFVMHALGHFTTATHAHQGKEELSMTEKPVILSGHKEPNTDGVSIAGSRMIGLVGRKMAAHKVLRKLEPARPASQLNGETTSSKNSGATRSSEGNCDFEGKGDLNADIKILEPTTLKAAANSFGIPRVLKPKYSQDSKTKQPIIRAHQKTINYDDTDDHHKLTDEARRLLKATREIVNLMHKDYHGMGRRKPPINNHEPQH